ncbi:hypothetical protein NGI46_28760 [Peribacillus butanolivorans]|uniref:hypothetical protein n=1 Tax=Peribacillus butanolivorans TaxID=421767 RepID=UPI00207D43BB|nr:hypothetical protein [Peribacillus butanolivorans]MCO0601289.1 hypothetical protein [Peribacillus butanolivorans]
MLKLLSINLLPVVIIHSLFIFLSQIPSLNEYETITFFQTVFQLFTPFLLLTINYKIAAKRDKSYFIPNFILILIGGLLGVAFGFLKWGIDVGGDALQNPDYETYGIFMFEAQLTAIVIIVGSLLCSISLIVKNRKKRSLA